MPFKLTMSLSPAPGRHKRHRTLFRSRNPLRSHSYTVIRTPVAITTTSQQRQQKRQQNTTKMSAKEVTAKTTKTTTKQHFKHDNGGDDKHTPRRASHARESSASAAVCHARAVWEVGGVIFVFRSMPTHMQAYVFTCRHNRAHAGIITGLVPSP